MNPRTFLDTSSERFNCHYKIVLRVVKSVTPMSSFTQYTIELLERLTDTVEALQNTVRETLTGQPLEYFLPETSISSFKKDWMPSTAPSDQDAATVAEILGLKLIPCLKPRIFTKPEVKWEETFRSSWEECLNKTLEVKLGLVESYARFSMVPTMMGRQEDIERAIHSFDHEEACSQIVSIFKNEELKKKYGQPLDRQPLCVLRWSPHLNRTALEETV